MALTRKQTASFMKQHRVFLEDLISEIEDAANIRATINFAKKYADLAKDGDEIAGYISEQISKVSRLQDETRRLTHELSQAIAALQASRAEEARLKRELAHAAGLNDYYYSVLYEGKPHPATTDMTLPRKTS